MGQVHSYYKGTGLNVPAQLNRDLVEQQLIEEFHWLPQDIAKIPYKWLQKFFIIRKQRRITLNDKVQVDAMKNKVQAQAKQATSTGRGQTRR